ncbi:YceI family protein [Flavobacterium sp. GT3R68]|uniref:YceI family protein n=1 Tax=Flavobacterium sp. GT3R68 TaxID=2594437 RepID=UPI000F85D6BE|nr:YceI family protein [Flavobacterium sp. GT3R68]RTY87275.1 YceI family protein [Flavobacterium sp. GSN2]TRW89425.1 YceI family protein [Flavobacterium sp. GT3R68]
MKKSIVLLITFLSFHSIFAQDKKLTKTGTVTFEASVPSFEEVEGTNESVTCILNIKTGEFASLALIKGFRFKIALMEEHFNENYMESDTYPKAMFKGVIQGFNWNIIGTASKEFKMKGKLELHGRSREIYTTVKLRKVDDALEILSDFNVNSEDFRISIPKVVSNKVSKTVNIKTNFLVK